MGDRARILGRVLETGADAWYRRRARDQHGIARTSRDLPIGTAYAVWTGIGAVGTASLGVVLFDEPATLVRLAFIGLIVVGIVGLNFASGGH